MLPLACERNCFRFQTCIFCRMAYIEFFTKEALEVAFVKKDVELDGRKLQLSLMGPLAKTTMPSLKRTSDSEKLNQKSQSPVLKRKKKQFKKTKKGKRHVFVC